MTDWYEQRLLDAIAAADLLREAADERDGHDEVCAMLMDRGRACRCGHTDLSAAIMAYDAARLGVNGGKL